VPDVRRLPTHVRNRQLAIGVRDGSLPGRLDTGTPHIWWPKRRQATPTRLVVVGAGVVHVTRVRSGHDRADRGGVVNPFTIARERRVRGKDGTEWAVGVVRGNEIYPVDPESAPLIPKNVVGQNSTALVVESVIANAVLWIAYKVWRRRDHKVVASRMDGLRYEIKLLERFPDQATAIARGEDLTRTLRAAGRLD
jgi:hypothetical protein